MSHPIERASRALCRRDGNPEEMWPDYVELVRTVLGELSEPSPEMLEAGCLVDSETGHSGNPWKIYPAMIREALRGYASPKSGQS